MATILKIKNNAGDLDTPKFYFYAVEFIERKAAKMGEDFCGVNYPRPDAGPYILLTLDGGEKEVRNNLDHVQKPASETGAVDFITLDDPAYAADIWKVRGLRSRKFGRMNWSKIWRKFTAKPTASAG